MEDGNEKVAWMNEWMRDYCAVRWVVTVAECLGAWSVDGVWSCGPPVKIRKVASNSLAAGSTANNWKKRKGSSAEDQLKTFLSSDPSPCALMDPALL